MGRDASWQKLGTFLDDCERQGAAVRRVAVTEDENAEFSAKLELETSLDLAAACEEGLCDPRVGPDGTVRFALSSDRDLVPDTKQDVAIEPTDATMTDEGVRVTLTARIPADRTGTDGVLVSRSEVKVEESGGQGEPTSGDESAMGRQSQERDVPPFKNPDLLADVYETHDTFAEMADALDMDVTAETVRRYMIDYEIHEPKSYQVKGTAGRGDEDPQPVVVSDGIGLPDDVTVDAFIETVQRSNTIYEVKQDIDIGRQDALEMLQDLNLLDLVVGRLATETERNITREDVVERLREASAEQ
jgi:hypothetical protein